MSAFLPRKFLLAGQLYQRLKSLLVAGTNVTLTADDAAQTITVAASGGGGLSDGDKGDITVGGGGTTLTIDNDAVTYAKIQNVSATDKVLGRSTAGAGDIEEIACTAAGRALLYDADAAAQRTTLGLGTAAQSSTGDFAAASHNHAASDINSGTVATARLGSGTANSTTFLRGDQTWAAPTGGSGDVVGPGSATDNAITRFDSTTGKLVQNSAATIDDDGVIRSSINSAACATTVPLTCWIMLTADYTLTSTTSEQKAFNTTTNGTLTLPTGVYEFEVLMHLLSMSTGASNNLAFDPVGAGTAVTDRWGWHTSGVDQATPTNVGTQSGQIVVTQQSAASLVSGGTGAGLGFTARGMFRISTGGTIIPSVTLASAAAAVMKAGSWFRIRKIGESSETYVGAWT